jgi:probable phosphoglycerate mutase
VLVRHGQTEWSASGKHTGRTDVPLTSDGEKQALALAPVLRDYDFALVLSSPLIRAYRTAELAGLARIVVDPDLQEWDYGGYEGLTTAEIRERRPGWRLWQDGVIPGRDGGGETSAHIAARADRIIHRALPLVERGADVALVSHGHFLRVLAARWLGLSASAGAYLSLDTASISALGFERGERVIRWWNEQVR